MVIALFALSLVMIVGGIAAVVQGFPYVRLESGLAMVIGGATAASAGAVLLGIAAAVTEMKRLAGALWQRAAGVPYQPIPDPVLDTPLRAPAFESAPPIGSKPMAATAGAAGLAGLGVGAARDLFADGERRLVSDPYPSEPREIELPLPDLLPPAVPGPMPPPAPGEPISPEDDLFVSPEDRPGHRAGAAADEPKRPDPAQEELALRPALPGSPPNTVGETEPTAAETPSEPAEDDKPKSDELQVVGTYSSGANTYVMFANGTIQADTPRGRFTFQSLDELKEFVDSGGETATRGAA